MATQIIAQKPPFTQLPNWLRGRATPLEISTLWCLQSHYPNIYPSLTTLAKEVGMAKSTLCKVLADMERKGWMVREQGFMESGRKANTRYRLTIWNVSWQVQFDSPGDGLVREADHVDSPSGGQTIVRETDRDSPGDGHKEEQSNKNKDLTRKEPPLPPKGQRRAERDDTHPYRDRDGFVVNPDRQPQATEAQPQPTQPVKPWEGPKQPPQPQTPPEPQPALATVLVDPQPKSRKAGFTPTEGNVPAALLPVVSELLEFWASKGGKKTERAWTAQLGQLNQIQADSTGGTEAARAQLLAGVQAATFGKAWCAVTYTNWQRYGRSRTPIGGTGFNRRMTQDEHAAEALAFIRERDARRAAEAAAQETQGNLILAEVV